MRLRHAIAGLILASFSVGPALAYPDKPVRVLVGLPPGTTVDLVARLVANHLSEKLKQPFIVENKVGAQGLIAAKEVAASAPNGYTLHLAGSIAAMNSTMKEGADIAEQFTYISLVRRSPTFLAMSTKRGFNTFGDLIAFGKKNPGVLNYGSIAKSLELYTVSINKAAGLDAVHVAFRGSGDASAALSAGDIDYYLDSANVIETVASRGEAKLIASTGAKRSADRPNVPSLPEIGLPGLDLVITYGLVAAKGTPDDIVKMLAEGVREFAGTKNAAEKFLGMGQGAPVSSTPEEFRTQVAAEIKTIEEAAKFIGFERQ